MRKTYDFTLLLADVKGLTDEQAERLYECCPDGTESESDWIVRVSFSRKARSFAEAVHSALRDLKKCGLRAARVELEELVSAAEIAERTARSRESVRLLIEGKRGPGGFPAPEYNGERFRLWRWPEVERWFAAYEKRAPLLEDHTAVVDAINLILALRADRVTFSAADRRELARVAKEERSAAVVA